MKPTAAEPEARETGPLVERARERLEAAGAGEIDVAVILGSGLGRLAEEAEDRIVVPYADIPGFPRSTIAGHPGNFVVGTLEGARVAFAQGRFHLYEGYSPAAVALPVRVLHALGPGFLFVTNAAGSIDRRNPPGTLLAIHDHLNLQFSSPLRGRAPDEIATFFPDLSGAWDPGLRARLLAVALAEAIPLREGVYAAVAGPSYETPAEIRFLRRIGADAVGMSTVAEAIVAAELGLPLVGVSLLTNYGSGMTSETLDHEDVTVIAERTRDRLVRLVRAFLRDGGVVERAGTLRRPAG